MCASECVSECVLVCVCVFPLQPLLRICFFLQPAMCVNCPGNIELLKFNLGWIGQNMLKLHALLWYFCSILGRKQSQHNGLHVKSCVLQAIYRWLWKTSADYRLSSFLETSPISLWLQYFFSFILLGTAIWYFFGLFRTAYLLFYKESKSYSTLHICVTYFNLVSFSFSRCSIYTVSA